MKPKLPPKITIKMNTTTAKVLHFMIVTPIYKSALSKYKNAGCRKINFYNTEEQR